MSTIADISQAAKNAIDSAMDHYFVHLSSGETKELEMSYVAQVLQMTQGWLMFTEESLQELNELMMKDTIHINFVYTLTMLFYNRFLLPREDYDALIVHLSNSFYIQEMEDPQLSFMSRQYSSRLTKPEHIADLMKNNRILVMFACMVLYLDTEIITNAAHMGDGKK